MWMELFGVTVFGGEGTELVGVTVYFDDVGITAFGDMEMMEFGDVGADLVGLTVFGDVGTELLSMTAFGVEETDLIGVTVFDDVGIVVCVKNVMMK